MSEQERNYWQGYRNDTANDARVANEIYLASLKSDSNIRAEKVA